MILLSGSLVLPFCFHTAHISFASSWYLFCLSVIVLARLCVFGTAMCIKKVSFVFLFTKVMSARLKGIVLSVSMLRLQYSLTFSFSNTLAGVYLQCGLLSSLNSAASASFWQIILASPSCLFTYSVGYYYYYYYYYYNKLSATKRNNGQ